MRKTTYTDLSDTANTAQMAADASPSRSGLPNRLMTAFEVAEFVGCHEETVRCAYLRGLLISQRFGVRGRRLHPSDVLDWIGRGAPTQSVVIERRIVWLFERSANRKAVARARAASIPGGSM